MDMSSDDNELAALAAKGNATAFKLLLERHYELFYRVAWRFCGNEQDAEDIAQDICLSLAGKLKSFRGNARFTTWAYRLAVNASHDFSRRQASLRRRQESYGEVASLLAADQADHQKRAGWMYEVLDRLGDPLRETALLVLAEGLSHKEVGEILNIKESSVSWRMHELRRKLKEQALRDGR